MAAPDIVTVFCTESEWLGDLLVQKLEEVGIKAHLANRFSSHLQYVLPKVAMEILVPAEKAPEAKELIDQFLQEQDENIVDEDVLEDDEAEEEPDEDIEP